MEVRGLKKQVGDINKNIENGFKAGEARFEKIEDRILVLEKTTIP